MSGRKIPKRLIKDFKALQEAGPASGIWIKDVSESLDKPAYSDIRMMIVGPDGPYKNCLFFFRIFGLFGEAGKRGYPINPPKCKFLCPYSIRCHPNLYRYREGLPDDNISNGKCCLSILGTWAGPPWTPMMTLETIAQTILMILDDEPLRNEPGFVNSGPAKIKPYTDYVRWICLKESIPMLAQPLPERYAMWQEEVSALLPAKREEITEQLLTLGEEFDGQTISATVYGNQTDQGKTFDFKGLLEQIIQ